MSKFKKPPLGVMPRKLYEENPRVTVAVRRIDLARAIYEYLLYYYQQQIKIDWELLEAWSDELRDLMRSE